MKRLVMLVLVAACTGSPAPEKPIVQLPTAAADAASMVSSVLPENEMANTNEPSPTNAGSS